MTLEYETAGRPDVEEIGRAEEAIEIVDPQVGEICHREKANIDAEEHKARLGQRIRDAALLGRGHRARTNSVMQVLSCLRKGTP
jgi:hypothetical protein